MEPSTNVDGEQRRAHHPHPRRRASMEPSTNVDGESSGLFCAACALECFNGAVDERRRRGDLAPWIAEHDWSLQWSRRRTSTERGNDAWSGFDLRRASMEPSTNVDGEQPTSEVTSCGGVLQWSRRRTSTERCASPVLTGFGIRLLQWSRRRTSTE